MHTKLSRFSLSLTLLPLALAPLSPTQAQTAAPQAVTKPTLTVLHSFTTEEGTRTQATLTVGADGGLFGVTPQGGANSGVSGGVIFKATQGGVFHHVADLTAQTGTDPEGPLLLLPDGTLMGSTYQGGTNNTGTLFLLTPPYQLQTKYNFDPLDSNGGNTKGADPFGNLALGGDGAVYGTAAGGVEKRGTVFRWTAAHGLEVMHDFIGSAQGDEPTGGLTLGPDGALYGATFDGGAHNDGEVFRITTDGMFSVLHSFDVQDGKYISVAPVVGPDDALYGVTIEGGANNAGTFYRITTDGQFTLVHSFANDEVSYTLNALTLGPGGKFYGTTDQSGSANRGTVFSLTTAGVLTTLFTFSSGSTGYYPAAGVTFEASGHLYGTTTFGGLYGHGTVYKLTLP